MSAVSSRAGWTAELAFYRATVVAPPPPRQLAQQHAEHADVAEAAEQARRRRIASEQGQRLVLVDTPGYGDADASHEFGLVVNRLDSGFRRMLAHERRIRRRTSKETRTSVQLGTVDVALYLFAPHRCKKADVAFLRRMQGKVRAPRVVWHRPAPCCRLVARARAPRHLRRRVPRAGLRRCVLALGLQLRPFRGIPFLF